ncbi:hypothetical protein EG340_18130 [Chryseobacterium indoltheticum]|uniref:RHS repeat protein n=1 Tax=Chryseobacterium indoltheticum TaxID=254 RepID=A0A3G6ND53_9FLAO|nr:hypothetical protein EG340_18130 [Chryseobacterium indoltheticum]
MTSSFSAQSGSTPSNDAGGNLPAILPPTPESFKFATYGNLPTGLFTGSTNIDIPITSFSSGNINLPLSLNYSSNGIKVDDTNGSVGLGWRFINAGVITRVIRDMPDELNTQGNIPTPDIVALGMNDPSVTNYFALCKDDGFDSESDLYMANFDGRSLKFIIERDGTFRQLEKSGCKIQRVGGGFVIKTEDGTEYTFNTTEKVRNFMTNTGQHHGGALLNTTSWYLSKVKSLQNKEINIQYNEVNFTAVIGKSQSMMFTRGGQYKYGPPTSSPSGNVACPSYCELQIYTLPPSIGLVADSNQTVIGKQIKKIYDEDGNYIFFEYQQQNDDFYLLKNIKKNSAAHLIENFDLDYDITSNNRVFLKYITETKSGRKHSFEYFNKEEFPNILSFSRDMWGYFNGINNSTLIPQIYEPNDPQKVNYNGANQSVNALQGKYGLLRKITYPTGGSTTINYENHKLQTPMTIPAPTSGASLETLNDRHTVSSTTSKTITLPIDSPIKINTGNAVYGDGNCLNSNLIDKQKTTIQILSSNGNVLLNETIASNSGEIFTINGYKDQPITVNLTARFFCSFASATLTYFTGGLTQGYQDKLLGGYRVASTVDESEGNPLVTKSYDYTKSDGSYSTIQAYDPYFLDSKQEGVSDCAGSNCLPRITYSYSTLTSTNVNQYNSSNSNIFYSRVIENLGGRGKIIHEFDTSVDESGSIHGDLISGVPNSNTAWQSGRELLITYLDSIGNTIKKTENLYAEDNTGIDKSYSLATRKKYELMGGSAENLDFVLYKNISRFSYLKNKKSTYYLNGVPLKTETEYFYDNPLHYQITKTVTTTEPDLNIVENKFQYAHEKANTKLINANIVGIPLETTVLKKQNSTDVGKVISRQETKYDDPTNLFPSSVLSQNLQTNVMSTELTYDQYDSKGNIVQYTTKDGVPTTIIWGYNSTQPIAKVTGLSYSVASTLASEIITSSDADINSGTEQTLIDKLDAFRKSTALQNAQITTYTYDPLIGVTSITPPSGIREIYKYDSANRLESIKDVNGKIIKEFQYNYKH